MLQYVKTSAKKSPDNHIIWECQCDCGDISEYIATRIRTKRVSSCKKCAAKKSAIKNTKHGKRTSDEYRIWSGIKMRCLNEKNHDYNRYGGKGVKMYNGWIDNFPSFLEYLGPRPSKKHSVDRIDNNGDYAPSNVRWATKTEQARNTSKSVLVTDGKTILHIMDVAEKLKISKGAAHLRLKRGKLNGYSRV